MFDYVRNLMNTGNRNYKIDILCIFFISALLYFLSINYCSYMKPAGLEFEITVSQPTVVQVFFNTGNGYNEKESKRISIAPHVTEHVTVPLPNSKVKSVRIDPMEIVGTFTIKSMVVKNTKEEFQLMKNDWNSNIIGKQAIKLEPNQDFLAGESLGDSAVEILQIPEMNKVGGKEKLVLGILSCLVVGGLYFSFTRRKGSFAWTKYKVAILLAIAFVVRLSYLNHSSLPSDYRLLTTVWMDENTYFTVARYILDNGFHKYLLDPISMRIAPGTPAYIYFLYSLFENIYYIRIISIGLNCVSLLFVYKIGCLQFDKKVAFLATILCVFFAELVKYSPTLLTEPPFFFLFIAGVYNLLIALKEDRIISFRMLLAGLLLGFAATTRSILLLYPVALLFFYATKEIYTSYRAGKIEMKNSKKIVCTLVVFLLVVGPICIKNYMLFGRFTMATGGGVALYLGSRADTEGDEPPYRGKAYIMPPTGDENFSEEGNRFLSKPSEMDHLSGVGDKILTNIGIQNIKNHPVDYMYWNMKKIGRLLVGSNLAWFYPKQSLMEYFYASGLKPTLILAGNITLAVMVALFGLLGMIKMAINRRNMLLSATIIYYIGISLPFLAIQRYGLPIYILLTLFASYTLLELYESQKFYKIGMMIAVVGIIDMYIFSGF